MFLLSEPYILVDKVLYLRTKDHFKSELESPITPTRLGHTLDYGLKSKTPGNRKWLNNWPSRQCVVVKVHHITRES